MKPVKIYIYILFKTLDGAFWQGSLESFSPESLCSRAGLHPVIRQKSLSSCSSFLSTQLATYPQKSKDCPLDTNIGRQKTLPPKSPQYLRKSARAPCCGGVSQDPGPIWLMLYASPWLWSLTSSLSSSKSNETLTLRPQTVLCRSVLSVSWKGLLLWERCK